MREIIVVIKYISRDTKIHALLYVNLVLAAVLSVAVAIGFYLYIYSSTLSENIESYKNYVEAYTNKSKYVEHVYKSRDKLENIYSKISSKYSQPELVRELRGVSEKCRVRLVSTSYRDEVYDDALIGHIVTLSVNGSYFSIKEFLKELRELRGLSVINTLTMSNAELGMTSADVQVTVYSVSGGS